MNPLVPFTADVVHALGWAILHSIWQTFFIGACLRLTLKLLPAASARIKYNLSYLSLGGAFVWFGVTFSQQLLALRQTAAITAHLLELTGQEVILPAAVSAPYRNQQALLSLFPSLEGYFPLLVGIYMAGVIIMGVKMVADLHQLSHIRKRHLSEPDPVWIQHLEKLAAQLDIRGHVSLFISHCIQVPVMIGFLKPVILLPLAMFSNLQPDQIEAVLLHELAHIKRNDYLLNIFQTIVETTLFFNPFIWWISKNVRLEREHCCDDLVIARTAQPLGYAKALVALEEYRLNSNPLAMAAASNQQHLFHRIKRIMEMKTKNLNYSQKILALLIVATGLFSIAWLNPPREKKTTGNEPRTHKALPASDTTITGSNEDSTASYSVTVSNNDSLAVPVPPPPPIPMAPISPVAPLTPPPPPMTAGAGGPQHLNMNYAFNFNTDTSGDEIIINNDPVKFNKDVVFYFDSSRAFRDTISPKFQYKLNQAIVFNSDRAMANFDWKKINAQVDEAMKKVDWKKIDNEINQAMKNVDTSLPGMSTESIRAQFRAGIQQRAHAEAMRKEMDAHRADWEKAIRDSKERQQAMAVILKTHQKDLTEAMKDRDRVMAEAMKAHNQALLEDMKARAENMKAHFQEDQGRNNFRSLINRLQADKMIDTEKYSIEKKGDDLYLNGKKQAADVADKYKEYFQGKRNVKIKGSDKVNHRSLDIDIND
ncbi:MAG TPA: M56 family metallopeptidase [Chitinophaga sp.]